MTAHTSVILSAAKDLLVQIVQQNNF